MLHHGLSDGYDLDQVRMSGQYSYKTDRQRDLQFHTDIKEIDLGRRVWHGEESELASNLIMLELCFF